MLGDWGEEIAEKEWTVVVGRHRKGRRKNHSTGHINGPAKAWGSLHLQAQPTDSALCPSKPAEDEIIDPEEERRLLQKMHNSVKKVEESSFYKKFMEQLNSPEVSEKVSRVTEIDSQLQMVVYGIGSIGASENSRLQLSLAILLKQSFSWVGEIEVFDPILSASECRVIESLGCTLLSVNEQGRRTAKRPTLFFMPHCEAFLYDNVLQANWSATLLNRIVLFGNSFSHYLQSVSDSPRSPVASSRYVLAIEKHVLEFGICTVSEEFFRAFNHISWHFFPLDASSEFSVSQM